METSQVFGARVLTPLLFSKLLVITAFSGETAETHAAARPESCGMYSTSSHQTCIATACFMTATTR